MSIPVILQIDYKSCTGCAACVDVCPVDALYMQLNEEGFYKPVINDSCTQCGLCSHICPVISVKETRLAKSEEGEPSFYAGWSTDDAEVKRSSSGGVFCALACDVLGRSGVVVAAEWDGLEVRHAVCSSLDDLTRFQGSKYLQSKTAGIYLKVTENLEAGREVLFVGTPCQVAALHSLTQSPKLMTVDLVCHGVPSMSVFQAYCETAVTGHQVKRVNFREKVLGWRRYFISLVLDNGGVIKTLHSFNPFFAGYLKNYYLNEPCYDCPFSKLPRAGDITLGDFWGAPMGLTNNDKGSSVVIANSEKGKVALERLTDGREVVLHAIPMKMATRGNPRIVSGKFERPRVRSSVISEVNEKGFRVVADRLGLNIPVSKQRATFCKLAVRYCIDRVRGLCSR